MSRNEVRIIGGRWKGRKLKLRGNASLRPTLGRVRETLFSWLAAEVAGSDCLDLFAGSGALGFEALSRGARSVVLVDNNRETVAALRENAERLGAENCIIRRQPALVFLPRAVTRWNLVFLDPPFASNLLAASLNALKASGVLSEEALVYCEFERRGEVNFDGWTVIKHATAGDTQFGLLASPSGYRYHRRPCPS